MVKDYSKAHPLAAFDHMGEPFTIVAIGRKASGFTKFALLHRGALMAEVYKVVLKDALVDWQNLFSSTFPKGREGFFQDRLREQHERAALGNTTPATMPEDYQ